jgi:hypothetical protein
MKHVTMAEKISKSNRNKNSIIYRKVTSFSTQQETVLKHGFAVGHVIYIHHLIL